jgi:hypothetical protein
VLSQLGAAQRHRLRVVFSPVPPVAINDHAGNSQDGPGDYLSIRGWWRYHHRRADAS